MMNQQVKFVKVGKNATIPTMAHENDAGNDLYSSEELIILPECRVAVSTGITWVPPIPPLGKKYVFVVQSRSGMAFKKHVEASNAGVVDHGYRGDIKVMLHNHTSEIVKIGVGDKIAQGIIYELPKMEIVEGTLEDLEDTSRGADGFGSSGQK
jgi:dUTP pyrophosphatase